MIKMLKGGFAMLVAALEVMSKGWVADDPFDCYYPIQAAEMDLKMRKRAVQIQRNLGTRSAAGYLRNRGVDLGTALKVLAGSRAIRA